MELPADVVVPETTKRRRVTPPETSSAPVAPAMAAHMESVILIEVTAVSPNFIQPWKMHGHDLTPLLKNPNSDWNHPVLTALAGEKYGSDTDIVPTDPEILYKTARVPWWISLMSGRHKYIRTLVEGEVEELYNLETDPEELTNLALDPKHLAKLRQMATLDF